MRVSPSIRRFALERLTVVALAMALAAVAVVPGGTSETPCADRRVQAPQTVGLGTRPDPPQPPTGIDLEVRVFNLRVEFPWMRALPVSPGHHIVISLLASDTGERRP